MRAVTSMLRGLCVLACLAGAACPTPSVPKAPPEGPPASEADSVKAVRHAIRTTWPTLVRSNADLARAAVDPKFPKHTGPWPVYVAATEDIEAVRRQLRRTLSSADAQTLSVRPLPAGTPREPGLLYLPHPYLVPGGRFNEMYGWDSYFILLGLLRNGDVTMARHLTDNLLYEVKHYGRVLNANRSYYLSRSQPPLLTRMVLAVHAQQPDLSWLRSALPALEKAATHWTDARHTTPTGLSRYADAGTGPAPEVVAGEVDGNGLGAYERVRTAFKTQVFPGFDLERYYDRAHDHLTEAFYAGDRAMRESGFDASDRFGPFGAATLDINPVCLNTLLYASESDMSALYGHVGDPAAARRWADRAAHRRDLIEQLLWDEASGLYLDYNFREKKRREYPYLTTFWPLWAGLSPPERAARVASNLRLFAAPGGLRTSTVATGHGWDAPFGWAPLQWFAVQGLRHYDFAQPAQEVSVQFLSMVTQQYTATQGLWEKYDVVTRKAAAEGATRYGYASNQLGFGWTNGVFEDLYATLPPAEQRRVGQ